MVKGMFFYLKDCQDSEHHMETGESFSYPTTLKTIKKNTGDCKEKTRENSKKSCTPVYLKKARSKSEFILVLLKM